MDYEGRYAVLNLAPGTWSLQAVAGSRQLSRQVELVEGDDEVVVDFEFKSGFTVAFEHLSLPVDGLLRVTTVPDGTWVFRLSSEGYVAPDMTLTSPGNAAPVVLHRAGRIQLSVRDLAEDDLAEDDLAEDDLAEDDLAEDDLAEDSGNASLVLTSPEGRPYLSYLGPGMGVVPPGAWPMRGGQALIPFLPPGIWSFTVTHDDGRTWSGQANVVAGEVAQVDLP